jgi:hypothetical protein
MVARGVHDLRGQSSVIFSETAGFGEWYSLWQLVQRSLHSRWCFEHAMSDID